MARLASVAVGGYFKTPPRVVDMIADRLAIVSHLDAKEKWRKPVMHVVDPCAGDGEAVQMLGRRLAAKWSKLKIEYILCEAEAERFAALQNRVGWGPMRLHCDAFRVDYRRSGRYSERHGASLLWLNPPYDTDREYGRLEERFLRRFGATLAPGGLLVFIVPRASLSASAGTLAREFEVLDCLRFPEPEFDDFRQVVLFARRRPLPLLVADPVAVARVSEWATLGPGATLDAAPGSAGGVGGDETGDEGPESASWCESEGGRVPVPAFPEGVSGLSTWQESPLDVRAVLAGARPWVRTARGGQPEPVPGVVPEGPIVKAMARTYPVAVPPRPAHIAAGIASGIFNGARVEPNPGKKLPPLLVKGVFDREFKTGDTRENKDGEIVAEVQVQQPRLVVTVLDLAARRYTVLTSEGVSDLLANYQDSLMRVMERQCPILYDPRREDDRRIPIVVSQRQPFAAQGHAVRATVKVLSTGATPMLLGEIGVGKSLCSLLAARTHGARRVLVMCPPHLLDGWRNEVAAVFPDAPVHVLRDVADVDALAVDARDDRRFSVALMTREAAKLGHAWEGVATCPKCGEPAPHGVDVAKKRSTCARTRRVPANEAARLCERLAIALQPHFPSDTIVDLLAGNSRMGRARKEAFARRGAPTWRGLDRDLAVAVVARLARAVLAGRTLGWEKQRVVTRALVHALPFLDGAIARAARLFACDTENSDVAQFACLLVPDLETRSLLATECRSLTKSYTVEPYWATSHDRWGAYAKRVDTLLAGEKVTEHDVTFEWEKGVAVVDKLRPGSAAAALRVLVDMATALARLEETEECGEHLYQASPSPRRMPLARYLVRRHPRLFDFLIVDEAHEYGSSDSAQSFAAHRLVGLGLPTIMMTGTVMNGYAESLFANFWAISPSFRAEFKRGEQQRFVDRYGYRKQVVEDRVEGKVVEFGSHSERVVRSVRPVGNAPGVLPLFLLRHLLPVGVTIHKADLAIDLPRLSQECPSVEPTREQRAAFERLQQALLRQIRADRFEPGLAGKLFGQLAELPSYLDRCTVGNDGGDYVIRYPESCGARTVAREAGFDPRVILPKEEWMLARVEAELAEGRRVMVFGWHLGLLPRLARIISERIGEPVPILEAAKVPTAKRQEWIDREVVRKGRRVMVANPVCIQTGLNNLVHFSTEVWHQDPACNPLVFRQAIGRIDRIGQKLPTRVFVPVYKGTLQEQVRDLLLRKVAVSTATDGLDPEVALAAAGAAESDYLAGLSIGKVLYAMLTREEAAE